MPSTETPPAKGRRPSAQDAILDAAETLFGQFGPEGVSLRQIGAAAGSSNNSAVQYHFLNKEGLLKGIYTRRLASLEQKRAELLAQAEQQGRLGDARRLLEILLLPISEETDAAGHCSYAAFLLGMYMYGDIARWNDYSDTAPFTLRLNDHLRTSLANLPDDVFGARLLAVVTAFLMAVVEWDRRAAQGAAQRFATRAEHLRQILDFVTAGMVSSHP